LFARKRIQRATSTCRDVCHGFTIPLKEDRDAEVGKLPPDSFRRSHSFAWSPDLRASAKGCRQINTTTFGTPEFGFLTAARDPRQIQFALKLSF